jgi:hypothetical protein
VKSVAAVSAIFIAFCASPAAGQGVQIPPATIQLSGYDMRGTGDTAGSNSTRLLFTLEADTTGNNAFEVATSDPGVVVSLNLPSGTAVTSANAASLGFTFTARNFMVGAVIQAIKAAQPIK